MRSRVFACVASLAVIGLIAAPTASAHRTSGRSEPRPIPGGVKVPGGPFIHTFAPGPVGLNPFTQGVDFEPNTIRDFRGFVAMAYLQGTATDNAGHRLNMDSDIRVMRGTYIGADGRQYRGTFAFL